MLTSEEWALTQRKRKKIVIKNRGLTDFIVDTDIEDFEQTSLCKNSRAIRLFTANEDE